MKNLWMSIRYSRTGMFLRNYGRSFSLTILTIASLVGVVAATQLITHRSFENSQAADVMMDASLNSQVMNEGKIRVLVRLNTSFQAEPTLSESAKNSQRANIAGKKDSVKSALSGIDHKVIHEYKSIPWVAIEVSPQALVKLQSLKGTVLEIKEDHEVEPSAVSNVPHLSNMRVPEARNLGYDGAGQVVAVIDQDFQTSHQYFSSVFLREVCVNGCPNGTNEQEGSGVARICNSYEDIGTVGVCGHGSQVSSMIAINDPSGKFHGVSDKALLIAIKTARKNCVGTTCAGLSNDSDILKAFDWIYENKNTYSIDVVNISIKAGAEQSSYCDATSPYSHAVDNLYNSNIPVVAGAGNGGTTSSLVHPACVKNAIPVGSVGGGTVQWWEVSPFSNRASWHQNMIFAPGYIFNALNPFTTSSSETISGTSYSTPLVAGSLALLNQAVYNAPISEKVSALKINSQNTLDTATNTNYPIVQVDRAAMWLRRYGVTSSKSGTGIDVTGWSHNPGFVVQPTSPYVNMAVVTAAYHPPTSSPDTLSAKLSHVSYCGVPMSKVGGPNLRTQYNNETVEIWYLMNPPTTSCAIQAAFDKNPGTWIMSATILHNVESQNPIASFVSKGYSSTGTAIADGYPNANEIIAKSTGVKGTALSCVLSTRPSNTRGVFANSTTEPDKYATRSLWSGTDSGNTILSQWAMNYQRLTDNFETGLRWTGGDSGTRYPWALLCIDIKFMPFASTSTPVTPPPAPLPGQVTLSSPGDGVITNDATPTFSWTKPANAVSYVHQVSSDGNFSSGVISTNVSALTYTPTSNLDGGAKYYWRVAAKNSTGHSGPWSAVRSFTLTSAAAPALQSPSNGANIDSVRPTFDWSDVPTATSYIVQVSPNSAFSSYTINITTTSPTSSYTHTSDLAKNSTYYWRVRPKFGTITGTMSAVSTFKTASPPNVPTLKTPSTGLLLTTTNSGNPPEVLKPRLTWETADSTTVSDPVSYDLQIAKTNTFVSTAMVRDITNVPSVNNGSTATLIKRYWIVDQPLSNGTTYYWRIRSVSSAGHKSNWSSVFNFKTPLAAPGLGSPQTGTTPDTLRPTFTWGAVSGATGYTVFIKYPGGTETQLAAIGSATITTFTPTSDLQRNKQNVSWRVRANSSSFGNTYSSSNLFNTPNPPNVPTLSLPGNNTTASTRRPTLRWSTAFTSSIPQPNGYDIQIATSSTFSNPVVNISSAGTPFSSSTTSPDIREWKDYTADLRAGTPHYWRVRAKTTGNIKSSWSATFKFTTP